MKKIKEAIEQFASAEYQSSLEKGLIESKTMPPLTQLHSLSMPLLALAAIKENNYYRQILTKMEHIADDVASGLTEVDLPMYWWMLGRMALAAQLQGDLEKASTLKEQLSDCIDKTNSLNPTPMATWAIAYLASLDTHLYHKYRELLKIQTPKQQLDFAKEPAKERDNYLWTLTMNLYAAAQAGVNADYEATIDAFKLLSSDNTLQGALNKTAASYQQWLLSILRQATFKMQDMSHFVALAYLIKVDLDLPPKVDDLDGMLAIANHLLVIEDIEKQAVNRLAQRPDHIFSPPLFISNRLFGANDYQQSPNVETGLKDPIVWQSYFQPIAALHVRPKSNSNLPPKPVWVYAHWDNSFPQNEGVVFTAHSNDSPVSIAKISFHPVQSNYPDGSEGCMYVDLLAANESENAYRLGSLMIEMVIRYSFDAGLGGRILLMSANDSGLFYWRLGFVPVDEEIYLDLFKQKAVDGSKMYLPQSACELWKEKFKKNQYPIQKIQPQITEKISINKDVFTNWFQVLNRLQNHAVSELILDNCISEGLIEELIFNLKYNRSLKAVTFKNTSLYMAPLARLLSCLVLNPTLESLSIEGYSELDASAMSALADVICSSTQLKTLCFSNVTIAPEVFKSLVSVLSSSSIETLSLGSLIIADGNLEYLNEVLRCNSQLKLIRETGGFTPPLASVPTGKPSSTPDGFSLAEAIGRFGVFPQISGGAEDTALASSCSSGSRY